MKRAYMIIAATAMLTVATTGMVAQDTAPWVLVLPADNQTGNPSLDPISTTVADTISRTLALLGDFEIREVSPEDIPEEVLRGNPSALRAFSNQQTMDYIVFGSLRGEGPGYDIDAAVWDRGSGAISVRESRRASSLFDTFSVADELAVEFLSAFSGQRIAFGEVRLQRQGWQDGQYRVVIDGTEVARNAAVVSGVLVGERSLVVEALTGPQTGDALLEVPITVREGGVTSLSFTMASPAGESAEIAAGRERNAADLEREPAADDENDSTVDAAEEGRETQLQASNLGRRTDFYAGLAYLAWRRDFNGRGRAAVAFDLWFDVAFGSGLELAGSALLVTEPGGTYSAQSVAGNAIATGAYEPEAEGAIALEGSIGWEVYQTSLGRRARLEVVPYAGPIYRVQWYHLRQTDGVGQGELVDAAFTSDAQGVSGWVYQQYIGLLGGLRARAVIGAFVVRVAAVADVNTAIGPAANGRELFLWDDGSENYTASGQTLSGVPESGMSWRGSFGLGFTF